MVRAIDELGAAQVAKGAREIRVRVGINTGPVVVGMVGTDTAHEYTAMGDAVNIAARMQATARAGSVLVTAATYRFVSPLVDAVDVGSLELKGKTEAIQAYEISGVKAGRTGTRGVLGLRSPLIGRDAQLARLRELFGVVRAGQGRVTCILGEPGIGKSRLLAELRADVERTDGSVRWIEGRCLSYGETLPYHLVLDLVRSLIGVTGSADESQVAESLQTFLRDVLGDGWAETYAYLGHLLSLRLTPDQQSLLTVLEIEAIKRYVASLILVLRAVSLRGPVVLVCDDLHWADLASVDTLLQALPSLASLPVLCILSSRVERGSPGWRMIAGARDVFGDALTEIRLDPLSTEDSRALVSNLLQIESLPADARDQILAKAEGNPFFVEEVIRMLIDRGAIVRDGDRWIATERVGDMNIPDTLQGLLLARIDRLPQESRRTLRVASVIGRQFGVTILERLLEAKTI
jgi:predicted ATPase